jgi:hypothetical protein
MQWQAESFEQPLTRRGWVRGQTQLACRQIHVRSRTTTDLAWPILAPVHHGVGLVNLILKSGRPSPLLYLL